MIPIRNRASQAGVATMFVTMVLLILITLMVITVYSLSSINLRTVGNLQTRKEAVASAQAAIETVIDAEFWNPATTQVIDINIDYDDDDDDGDVDADDFDYQVTVAAPTCLRATLASITSASSVTLPGFSAASAWNTIWVLDATAINDASGTRVRVRQGVRVLMSEADKNSFCPTT